MNGRVFCQNGDASLPLQVVGVHHALHHGLIFPVNAALLQHLVHQGGLAVVNVGDDGDIAQIIADHMYQPPNDNFKQFILLSSAKNVK